MVRPNELSFARRGALSKLADRARGARPGHLVGRLVGLDSEDDHRAIVAFGDAEVSVLSGPHKLVPGALVAVEVDSTNAPTRITGPVTTRPEGLDEDIPAPDAVVPMPELGPRELTEAEAQAIQDTADGLDATQGRVDAAEGLLNAIGASDGPDGVADAISDYLSIPLDQITVVDNRGADGNVIANLYDAIIVDGLLTASGVITEDLIATGAIESRHLNVVPEEGTGGVEILPPGIRIIPADAEAGTAISFRSDEDSWITFAKGGETTFSVGPEGDAVAESVEARQSLIYRGNELADLLNPDHLPRGIIQRFVSPNQRGYYYKETGIGYFSFLATPGRMYRVSVRGRLRITEGTAAYIRAKVRHTGSIGAGWPGNLSVNDPELGAALVPINAITSYRTVNAEFYWTYPNPDLGAEKPTRILFTIDALTASAGVQMGSGTEFVIEDVGLIPEGDFNWHMGGSDGGIPPGSEPTPPTPPPAKRNRTTPWTATSHRTYSYTSLSHVRAGQSLVQGAIEGTRSRGHWIFNDTNIRSTLNGADLTSGTLTIRNQHSYAASGMTAVLRYHNYSTAPSTFGTSTAWTTVHVARGGSATVPLSSTILNGLKSGTIRGFSLDAGSSTATSHYGYFSPSATVTINYRK